ncbi:MAG: polysaccharide deacetylase family protein [Clostridia bacterium]|nr:polysaccharide deacetylase family protein [Clostridia bacterium]
MIAVIAVLAAILCLQCGEVTHNSGSKKQIVAEKQGTLRRLSNEHSRNMLSDKQRDLQEDTVLPVLMFHHIDDESSSPWVITQEAFENDLRIIRDAGYQPVSMTQLVNYIYYGEDLPANPVCITFDDGYLSNYELAYPLLKQYHMKATIFAIGKAIGYHTYGETDIPITPHFFYAQAIEMIDSGLIEVQSHTYNMHQTAKLETHRPVRESAAQLAEEPDDVYIQTLQDDLKAYQKEYSAYTGKMLFALAYPKGAYSELTEQTVREMGYKITFTTRADHKNVLIPNEPETLYQLGRLSVSGNTTADELRQYLADGYIE